MSPHPRIRKTIKWGGAAVTVLLVVGLISTWMGPWSISADHSPLSGDGPRIYQQRHLAVQRDYAEFVWFRVSVPAEERYVSMDSMPAKERAASMEKMLGYIAQLEQTTADFSAYNSARPRMPGSDATLAMPARGCVVASAPLWQVRTALGVLLAVCFGIVPWMGWRRRPVWACVTCGYDRRGLVSAAVCPECGDRPTIA